MLDAGGLLSVAGGLAGEGTGDGGLGEILLGGPFSGNPGDLIGNVTLFPNSLPPSTYNIGGGGGGAGGGAGGSPVPEPPALPVLGLGLLVVLGCSLWRKFSA
jgi:hypothetical protein